MKAVSLWQPWAALIALGVKTVETRSWQTSYRGELAIHAAKRRPPYGPIGEFLCEEYFYDVRHVDDCGCEPDGIDVPCARRSKSRMMLSAVGATDVILPLGMVVATCTLIDIIPTDLATLRGPSIEWFPQVDPPHDWERFGPGHVHIAERQRPYGDYGPGRFAWLLDDIKPLPNPVPARGRQQLWDCDVIR